MSKRNAIKKKKMYMLESGEYKNQNQKVLKDLLLEIITKCVY